MARLDVAKIVILLLRFQYLGLNWQLTGSGVKGEFIIPNLSKKAFEQLADINIGVLVAMTDRDSPITHSSRHHQELYSVVAVVDSLNSEESKASAQILGPAAIPHISSRASSDEFSNFVRFPYFTRVVPAYRHESKLVIDILKEHGWTYVSVLYSAGSYGESAFHQVRKQLASTNICMAVVRELDASLTDEQADEVAQQLVVQGSKATVVIVLLQYKEAVLVFLAIQRLNLTEPFVMILSESVGKQLPERTPIAKVLADAIVVEILPVPVPEFNDWFKQLTPAVNPVTPLHSRLHHRYSRVVNPATPLLSRLHHHCRRAVNPLPWHSRLHHRRRRMVNPAKPPDSRPHHRHCCCVLVTLL
ncbi:hypothetical protein ACOMHN_061350 [Nucella lapillus]